MPRSAASYFWRALSISLVWLVSLGFWICFTAKLTADELIVGSLAAAVGTLGLWMFHKAAFLWFRPAASDLLQGWPIPWYLASGSAELLTGLGRQLFARSGAPSLIRTVPYEISDDTARTKARAVLAIIYTTITPNFIVIGIARDQQELIYHQIIPSGVLQMTRNLGAKP